MAGKKQDLSFLSVRLKRAYEEPEEADGFRVLVDRLWPRGISKEKARISLWLRDVAPSSELRAWYHAEPDKWDEFEGRYFRELDDHPETVDLLWKQIEDKETVTFVYSSKNEERNNAVALRDYLMKRF
ncbi:MAG TPA: DUF488 family protein [Deltaproteobacteria bacterium]|jgi:uncharacterized protein YeaO (DUF488 family)|nr:DUF488 family protein [Deltaproteobacteria bacterium]HOI06248.1 DUF488 family protein [Deltaproteobacteria bacterium]